MATNAASSNHAPAKGYGSASRASSKDMNPLQRVSQALTGRTDRAMYKLGHYTALHPCRIATLAILVMAVLACGVLIHFEYDNTGDEIW